MKLSTKSLLSRVTGAWLLILPLSFSPTALAVTVPLKLEEEVLTSPDTSLQDTFANILQLTLEMLEAKVSYAQVVENQILVNIETYQVTIERSPGAWKTTLYQKDAGSTIGYYPYGQNPQLDAGLNRYLPES